MKKGAAALMREANETGSGSGMGLREAGAWSASEKRTYSELLAAAHWALACLKGIGGRSSASRVYVYYGHIPK